MSNTFLASSKRPSLANPLGVFLAIAMFAATGCTPAPAVPATGSGATDSRPTAGSDAPQVVVNIFCDYQCPACRSATRTIDSIVSHFGDVVQVRYHQLPLMGTHPLARDAAVYALAAHRQNRFACMHSILFRRQREWSELNGSSFREQAGNFAVACGLDLAQFERDAADPALGRLVDDDAQAARVLGADGTPTIYINGIEPIRWARPEAPHRRLTFPTIRRELREAAQLLDQGVPLKDLPGRKIFGNTGDDARARALTAP